MDAISEEISIRLTDGSLGAGSNVWLTAETASSFEVFCKYATYYGNIDAI